MANTNNEAMDQLDQIGDLLDKVAKAQVGITKAAGSIAGEMHGWAEPKVAEPTAAAPKTASGRRGANPFLGEDGQAASAPDKRDKARRLVAAALQALEECREDGDIAKLARAGNYIEKAVAIDPAVGTQYSRTRAILAAALGAPSFAGKAAGVGSVRPQVADLGDRIGVEQARTGADRGVRDSNVQTPSAKGSPDRSTPAIDWMGPEAAKAPGVSRLSNSYAVTPVKAIVDAQASRQSSAPSAKGAPSRPLQDDAAYQLPKAQIDPMTWKEYDVKPVRPGR